MPLTLHAFVPLELRKTHAMRTIQVIGIAIGRRFSLQIAAKFREDRAKRDAHAAFTE